MVPDNLKTHSTDDIVANFQVENRPLRGRITRLGSQSLGPILARHDYPAELARVLGEATTLAALVGSSLKFKGRLLVQAEGNGPVSLLVGEYSTEGGLRGYAKYDRAAWDKLQRLNRGGRPHMPQLFGTGVLALIIIQDNPSIQPYQGVVPLEKATLAECAEDYFAQSEQVPTKIALSVAELTVAGQTPEWRAGGLLLQRIAADELRGNTEDAWDEARALFGTVTDAELADPELHADRLLYRLFHESGVRMESSYPVRDTCTCNEERLKATLLKMPDSELVDMAEDDGTLGVDCQFCARHYDIALSDVARNP
ncbi:MAG: Hsp33 family molecular chaperone HslO [Pseudomonadota bacterium]